MVPNFSNYNLWVSLFIDKSKISNKFNSFFKVNLRCLLQFMMLADSLEILLETIENDFLWVLRDHRHLVDLNGLFLFNFLLKTLLSICEENFLDLSVSLHILGFFVNLWSIGLLRLIQLFGWLIWYLVQPFMGWCLYYTFTFNNSISLFLLKNMHGTLA